ncbi:MAG: hypothetical protein RLY58_2341 [Pseudomonadota bacterium]|jgi:hypothetical protein
MKTRPTMPVYIPVCDSDHIAIFIYSYMVRLTTTTTSNASAVMPTSAPKQSPPQGLLEPNAVEANHLGQASLRYMFI